MFADQLRPLRQILHIYCTHMDNIGALVLVTCVQNKSRGRFCILRIRWARALDKFLLAKSPS